MKMCHIKGSSGIIWGFSIPKNHGSAHVSCARSHSNHSSTSCGHLIDQGELSKYENGIETTAPLHVATKVNYLNMRMAPLHVAT